MTACKGRCSPTFYAGLFLSVTPVSATTSSARASQPFDVVVISNLTEKHGSHHHHTTNIYITITPLSHHHHTTITPPSHHTITPPSHHHHTTITPSHHQHHTTITPPSLQCKHQQQEAQSHQEESDDRLIQRLVHEHTDELAHHEINE
ncbi:hypothetical protein C0Q70_04473 [Pomacea canaliculata]|uniref:Uncharacterized protein n=1 Tax=Pomacea canaliculata TaxID=400727 RepID=A0A2T7PIH8_POMCA|nr:hypothetical protein C0Q70_04473 [Pomacea canaliculata]